jgi:CheY-like chemotaxis protein
MISKTDKKKDGAKVLIVEDDCIGNRILPKVLRTRYGFTVDEALNGETGIELVSGNHYDIVFMDIMMPLMDGGQATASIRALEGEYFRDLPILGLVAGKIDDELIIKMLECGMTDWVGKPISFIKLEFQLIKYLNPEDNVILYGIYKIISERFIDHPDFIENNLVRKHFFSKNQFKEKGLIENFIFTVSEYPERFENLLTALVKIINEIQTGRYSEARKRLGIKDDYVRFSDDIFYLRNWIKSWLYALNITNSYVWDEVKRLQEIVIKELKDTVNPDREKLAGNVPYQEILTAFCRIRTDSDLQSFNHIFEASILDLIFNLADLIIRKGQKTIEILSAETQFKETCNEIAIHLKHFRKELDDLR